MKISPSSSLIVYGDGSLTPDGAGAAVIVLNAAGKLLHLENKILKLATNNEAEYAALTMGLQIASHYKADILEIRLDSEVVINQMQGNFAVRSHRLKLCHWEACNLARQFPKVRYTYIPREQNMLADALAAEASAGRHWQIGVKSCSG